MSPDNNPDVSDGAGEPRYPAVVYQAQGSVSVGHAIGVEAALELMREYAIAHDLSLPELATMIMEGSVVLDPPTHGD
jgi:hypothetical protein